MLVGLGNRYGKRIVARKLLRQFFCRFFHVSWFGWGFKYDEMELAIRNISSVIFLASRNSEIHCRVLKKPMASVECCARGPFNNSYPSTLRATSRPPSRLPLSSVREE